MLYRGVNISSHEASGGYIKVNGGEVEVTPRYDGKARHDGTFTYGSSRENAVNAQHIETGTWGTAFVSATTSRATAHYFATHDRYGGEHPGVIYVLNPALFDRYGVQALTSQNPKHPEESEVSIVPTQGDTIPSEVIVGIEFVFP